MKLTLIQSKYFNIWESIGLGYIGAYLKKHLQGIEISFFQPYFDDDAFIIEEAKTSNFIGISCTTPTFRYGLNIARAIKEKNHAVTTIFGGFHPSACPDEVISHDCVDHVVIGEGEIPLLEILSGRSERIVRSSEKLDFFSLPHPDRLLIKNHREIELCEKMVGLRMTSFQSVRGCPFHCAFCSEHAVSGTFDGRCNPLRIREADDLLDEIVTTKNIFHINFFKFCDATFNVSSQKVIDFCQRKIARKIDLPWECNVHAGLAEEEMLYWMKQANCHQINVGCESGSPKILRQIGKGVSVEKIRKVFQWGKKYDLNRRAYFVIGMPDETLEDVSLTERLIREIEPDVLGITLMCPYPGSQLYDPRTQDTVEWEKTDEYSNDFWKTMHFTNQELKNHQNRLLKLFEDHISWHNKLLLNNRGES